MTEANGHDREGLIHDWNDEDRRGFGEIQLDDETLRDGLQSPSALDPSLDDKIELIHLMDRLGIDTANVGLPGAGDRARDHILGLAMEMKDLSITPNVACRTVISDIAPAADIQQKTGQPGRGLRVHRPRARSASTPRTGSSIAWSSSRARPSPSG